jgi:hypothetical protein
MLHSNYNTLTLPMKAGGKYKIGDNYKCISKYNFKESRFDGLEIKNIDYCFGLRLHFNYADWARDSMHELKQD